MDDVKPYLWDAAVATAPLWTARGIQNKVLEAVAAGLPCVVVPPVAEGLPPEVAPARPVASDAASLRDTALRTVARSRPPSAVTRAGPGAAREPGAGALASGLAGAVSRRGAIARQRVVDRLDAEHPRRERQIPFHALACRTHARPPRPDRRASLRIPLRIASTSSFGMIRPVDAVDHQFRGCRPRRSRRIGDLEGHRFEHRIRGASS